MEAALILPALGLVLPPRYALRLAALGVIAIVAFAVYGNTTYDPGAGHAIGVVILGGFAALYFGAILAGLGARWLWHLWRGAPDGPGKWSFADLSVPPAVDQFLAGLTMLVPAGLVALALGTALAGSSHPLLVHLGLLAACLSLGGIAVVLLQGMARAAAIGLALWMAIIVSDSMRLEGQVIADAARQAGSLPMCLAIGPDGLGPDQLPPLMGLTAPKPILLRVGDTEPPRLLRWSFRWHGFVRGGIRDQDVRCLPAQP